MSVDPIRSLSGFRGSQGASKRIVHNLLHGTPLLMHSVLNQASDIRSSVKVVLLRDITMPSLADIKMPPPRLGAVCRDAASISERAPHVP